jgi:hypothetical protein
MARTDLLLLFIVLVVAAAPAGAQAPATLVLETNAPEALVLANGAVIGRADEEPLYLPEGTVEVVLIEDAEAWESRRAAATVQVEPGAVVALALDLPVRYRIETMPARATVVLETEGREEVLGETPLVLDRPEALSGTLVARRPGFLPASLAPGDSLTNRHTLMLRPLEAGARDEAAAGWMPPPRRPNPWIDIAAAGVAIAAAGVAVHYKFQADSVDDRYRNAISPERGDPALKAEAERLDVYSLSALGVMQLGLGVLAVRFVLR